MIKAVLIDIDDTLLDFKKCAEESIFRSAGEIGLSLPSDVIETFVYFNDQYWREIEKGTFTKADLRRERFNTIFASLGIKTDGEAFDDLFKKNLHHAYVKVDGAEDLLKYLSRYKVYAASNAHDRDYQKTRLTRAGLIDYFDGLFVSGQIGANKPSKEFFDICMETLQVEPNEIVMIGDSLSADISGAKEYGFHTVWFDKYGVGVGDEADFVAKRLLEIIDIFRSNYE